MDEIEIMGWGSVILFLWDGDRKNYFYEMERRTNPGGLRVNYTILVNYPPSVNPVKGRKAGISFRDIDITISQYEIVVFITIL